MSLGIRTISPDIDVYSLDTQYLRNMIIQVGKLTDNEFIEGYESEDNTELANLYLLNFTKAKRSNLESKLGDDELALFNVLTKRKIKKIYREEKTLKKKEESVLVIEHRTIEDFLKENNEILKKMKEDVDFLVMSMSELMKIEDEDEDEGKE